MQTSYVVARRKNWKLMCQRIWRRYIRDGLRISALKSNRELRQGRGNPAARMLYIPSKTSAMTRRALIIIMLIGGMAGIRNTRAQQTAHRLHESVSRDVEGEYLMYLPRDYESGSEEWPLLLFLHGAGERGSNLDLVKKHGPPKLIEEGHEFPFIVVSPQVPEGRRWEVEFLTALLDDLTEKYRVDESRIYVTGLSMGGFGTWALATEAPERFAAIAPICGGGDALNACRLKNTPTWVFHGALDPVVPIDRSVQMVRALMACDGNVQFTVYPMAEHDSWTETYSNPEFYEWLLKHQLKN